MNCEEIKKQLEKKYNESQQIIQEAENQFADLTKFEALEKQKFFDLIFEIKAKTLRSTELLLEEKKNYAFEPILKSKLDEYLVLNKQKCAQMSSQLSKLICPEVYRMQRGSSISKTEENLFVFLERVRRSEFEFLGQLDTDSSASFTGLVRDYYELSNALSLGLLHYLDEGRDSDHAFKIYIRLTNESGFTGNILAELSKVVEGNNAAFVVDLRETVAKILDDYYQEPDGNGCLHFVTMDLKAFAKKYNLNDFERNLDEKMVIVNSQKQIKKIMSQIRSLFGRGTGKVGVEMFLEVFKGFCQILIELEFDKPGKEFHVNEFYQYGFLLIVFRVFVKVFMISGLEASNKLNS